MKMIDLVFPVLGRQLPTDNGYPLYSAISRCAPQVHAPETNLLVGPVSGRYVGGGILALDMRSRLRLRVQAEHIAAALPLAGKQLKVLGHSIRLGVPEVHALEPAPQLIARMVTIKNATTAEAFQTSAGVLLDGMGLAGKLELPRRSGGPHQGEPLRRVLRIKDRRIVGFTVVISDLRPDASLQLQEKGLGGRQRMGCGFFVPYRPRPSRSGVSDRGGAMN
jgi:CRISPR-associated protein Cas6